MLTTSTEQQHRRNVFSRAQTPTRLFSKFHSKTDIATKCNSKLYP
jgi:hypothetical protein